MDPNDAAPDGISLWQLRSNGEVTCDPGSSTSNLAQNLLITRAYAKLYIDNPRVFKWAGMAAFASDMVGIGILTGKATDVYIDAAARGENIIKPPHV